jgi:hypothetical protein
MEGKFSGEQVFMHRIRAPSKIKSFWTKMDRDNRV